MEHTQPVCPQVDQNKPEVDDEGGEGGGGGGGGGGGKGGEGGGVRGKYVHKECRVSK